MRPVSVVLSLICLLSISVSAQERLVENEKVKIHCQVNNNDKVVQLSEQTTSVFRGSRSTLVSEHNWTDFSEGENFWLTFGPGIILEGYQAIVLEFEDEKDYSSPSIGHSLSAGLYFAKADHSRQHHLLTLRILNPELERKYSSQVIVDTSVSLRTKGVAAKAHSSKIKLKLTCWLTKNQ